MEFSVGDKVMYPSRGAGTIVGVEHQELVDGFEHYYVIEIPGDGLTVRVPMRKADELGVRPVMSRAELARVLDILTGSPRQLSGDYKKRQERIQEKLRIGHAIQMAEVVRDLIGRERSEYLTKRDGDLLAEGRDFLAGEIALTTDTEVIDVHKMIDTALDVTVVNEPEAKEREQRSAAAEPALGVQKGRQSRLDSFKRYAAQLLGLGTK